MSVSNSAIRFAGCLPKRRETSRRNTLRSDFQQCKIYQG